MAKAAKDLDVDESDIVPPLDLMGLSSAQRALEKMDQVFGIYYEVPQAVREESGDDDGDATEDLVVPNDVMDLVVRRSAAKDAKDWELADSLRSKISELGFSVKDVKDGSPIVSKV